MTHACHFLVGLVALAGDQHHVIRVGASQRQRDRATAVALDAGGGRRCESGEDLGDDRVAVFAARVVVGDDHAVGAFFRDRRHLRALAAIAVAAAAEHAGQAAGRVLAQARQRLLERVGRVRVVDDHQRLAVVAAGLTISTGSEPDKVFAALEHLTGAKGRLEFAGEKQGAPIFVDYAHKPDALDKALAALRPYVKHELVVVFGCGGDRDQGKRPLMGEIAAKAADRVIVTDDNPRSENPAAIRAAILKAAPGAREIGDRGEAIRGAIASLRTGDVLLIAGKGHESGQIIGDRTLPFSDHEAVAAALKEVA